MRHARTAFDTVRGALSAARRRDDSGVTLIEVVVASVLLGVLASAVLGVILQTQSAQIGNRSRIAAANLAAREIDLVREEFNASDAGPLNLATAGVTTNVNPLDGGTAGQPLVVDGQPFTVVRSASWNITVGGASACEGGTLITYPTLGVTVTVTWPNMGSIQPVVSHAVFAPEKDNGIPGTASFVAVSVVDSAGQPNAGRAVKVESGASVQTGFTDPSGCAVIQVEPAAVTGTDYTVTIADPGYVDISSTEFPSKATGLVTSGTLNNSLNFAVELAGTVNLVLFDPAGDPLSDGEVAGAHATLVASEYSGASGNTEYTLSGVTTAIQKLWPTYYGGYFGAIAPTEGYPTVLVTPGATVTLNVPFVPAELPLTSLPAGTSAIVAVPHGAGTTCTTSGAKTLPASAPSATINLLPGTWDFFAVGSYFGCSPGDVSGTVVSSGENLPVAWNASSLAVVNAPSGVLWAVDRALIGPLASCPGSAAAGIAQNIDGARVGQTPLLAGNWYLYVTDGAADGTCGGFMPTFNPKAVLYGQSNTVTWPAHIVSVTVADVERIASGPPAKYPTVWLTTTKTLACNDTGITTIGGGTAASWDTTGHDGSITRTLADGTWYVYGNDQNSGTTSGWTTPQQCRLAGTIRVGPLTTGPLTIDYDVNSPKTVGP